MQYSRSWISIALIASGALGAAAAPQSTGPLPPNAIDGSKVPERIPDLIAYRLVFRAFAEPPNATTDQHARQRRKLSQFAFDEPDIEAFASVLSDFYVKFMSVTTGTGQASPRGPQSVAAAKDNVVMDTLAQLNSRVSTAALVRFTQFVQNAKRKMTIVAAAQN